MNIIKAKNRSGKYFRQEKRPLKSDPFSRTNILNRHSALQFVAYKNYEIEGITSATHREERWFFLSISTQLVSSLDNKENQEKIGENLSPFQG